MMLLIIPFSAEATPSVPSEERSGCEIIVNCLMVSALRANGEWWQLGRKSLI